MRDNNSIIVSWDFEEDGQGVLIVGQRNKEGAMNIVNAFENEEAQELKEKLLTVTPASKEEEE